jgi:hypothetical protein
MPGKSKAAQQAEQSAAEEGRNLRSTYSPAFNARATELCMLGHTNEELALCFNVNPDTIQQWLIEKPSFRKAVDRGREAADAKVAHSLYRRATGAKVKASKIFNHKGKALVVDYIEHYPPDTNAAALWLSNRQRSKWRAANAGGDPAAGFDLAGFVGALGAGIAKGLKDQAAQPGDTAAPIDPLDVVLEPEKKG